MMYLPFILTALLDVKTVNIDYIDSKDNPKIVFIIINDTCKVPINKVDLRDHDAAVEKALEKCGSL